MTNIERNIIELLLQNRQSEAVSVLFEQNGVLSESKEMIDHLTQNLQHLQNKIGSLDALKALLEKNKIKAIKIIKDNTGLGLKESKELADEIDAKLFHKDGILSTSLEVVPKSDVPTIQNMIKLIKNIRELLVKGAKIKAVKFIRDEMSLGLQEAKNLMEKIEFNLHYSDEQISNIIQGGDVVDDIGIEDSTIIGKVRDLLAKNRKIEAIKYVVEQKGLGLRDAKNFVESL